MAFHPDITPLTPAEQLIVSAASANSVARQQQTNVAGSATWHNADGTTTLLGPDAGPAGIAQWVGDTTPPGKPTGLRVSSQASMIMLAWDGGMDGGIPADFDHLSIYVDGKEEGTLTARGTATLGPYDADSEHDVTVQAWDNAHDQDGTPKPNGSVITEPLSVVVKSAVDSSQIKDAQDKAQSALDKVIAVEQSADEAKTAAEDAKKTANVAKTTADGKNRIFGGQTEPDHKVLAKGDLWFATNDDGHVTSIQIYNGNSFEDYVLMANKLLVAGSVGTTEIADNAIITGKIGANAVTALQIAANAITADKITSGAITSAKIDANAITSDKLSSHSVTADKLFVRDQTNLWGNQYFDPGGPMIGQATDEPAMAGKCRLIGARDHYDTLYTIEVTEGEQFVIEADCKRINGSEKLNGGIYFTEQDSGDPWWHYPPNLVKDYGNGWQRLRWYTEVPDKARHRAGLFFQINQWEPYSTQWLISNVTWRRRNAGEMIVDGSITADKVNVASLTAAIVQSGRFVTPDGLTGFDANGFWVKNPGGGYQFLANRDGVHITGDFASNNNGVRAKLGSVLINGTSTGGIQGFRDGYNGTWLVWGDIDGWQSRLMLGTSPQQPQIVTGIDGNGWSHTGITSNHIDINSNVNQLNINGHEYTPEEWENTQFMWWLNNCSNYNWQTHLDKRGGLMILTIGVLGPNGGTFPSNNTFSIGHLGDWCRPNHPVDFIGIGTNYAVMRFHIFGPGESREQGTISVGTTQGGVNWGSGQFVWRIGT